jgi:hypothetical protein
MDKKLMLKLTRWLRMPTRAQSRSQDKRQFENELRRVHMRQAV